MNTLYAIGTLVIVLFFTLGFVLLLIKRSSDNHQNTIIEQDPTTISNDAREFLKLEGYNNTRYNQKMLEDFQVYRNFKHQSLNSN